MYTVYMYYSLEDLEDQPNDILQKSLLPGVK